MVFSELIFIYAFLPLFIIFYFLIPNLTYKNVVLVVFSLVFYAWGEPVWVLLLIGSTLCDYINGLFIKKHFGTKKAKLGVAASLFVNLGLLLVFKYGAFFTGTINAAFGVNLPVHQLDLPIGISFYSFQSISYIVDVYRGKVKAQTSFLKFLMYISMFFQLVAGPIVCYGTIEKQIERRDISITNFSQGLIRFCIGLGKKVIIANQMGFLADEFLGKAAPQSVAAAWFGVIMFALQIYYDFSGYSDMAIGMGKMAGFTFLENFNYPYISGSAKEFWRRWHISLGSFFREYVYIPLGGNRKHLYLNLAIVWFLTGLWHGASWNFIIWGCYFGFLIIIENLFLGKVLEKIPRFFSVLYLLFAALIGWAVFYFTDLAKLGVYLAGMFGAGGIKAVDELTKTTLLNNIFIIAIAVISCAPIVPKIKAFFEKRKNAPAVSLYTTLQTIAACTILILSSVLLVGDTNNPFLYFRF
ncbi:MAG: MBOAT family protein [Ruminococcus sp.]|jgi:alginate O-acetyltransferase complex protein AlgI|nr:MBOAT family protein [Ruminococcus sp.]